MQLCHLLDQHSLVGALVLTNSVSSLRFSCRFVKPHEARKLTTRRCAPPPPNRSWNSSMSCETRDVASQRRISTSVRLKTLHSAPSMSAFSTSTRSSPATESSCGNRSVGARVRRRRVAAEPRLAHEAVHNRIGRAVEWYHAVARRQAKRVEAHARALLGGRGRVAEEMIKIGLRNRRVEAAHRRAEAPHKREVEGDVASDADRQHAGVRSEAFGAHEPGTVAIRRPSAYFAHPARRAQDFLLAAGGGHGVLMPVPSQRLRRTVRHGVQPDGVDACSCRHFLGTLLSKEEEHSQLRVLCSWGVNASSSSCAGCTR